LQWREEWTLEVGFMDEDHRHLADLLNAIARDWGLPRGLGASGTGGTAPEEFLARLEELADHTREHFRREEDVMRTLRYPDLPGHKSEHDLLLAELTVTLRRIRDSGADGLDRVMLHGLKDWLMGHVLEMDRSLADYLKNPPKDLSGDAA
jgi:hemerythrin-like metal-binding protein